MECQYRRRFWDEISDYHINGDEPKFQILFFLLENLNYIAKLYHAVR